MHTAHNPINLSATSALRYLARRMARRLHRYTAVVGAIFIVSLLAACGGGGTQGTTAAVITAQPTDQSVVVGTTATFNVVSNGATGYQWQSKTNGGTTFTDVNGATAAAYTTVGTLLTDSGTQYRVVVTGANNSVISTTVTLSVIAASVAPGITVHPAGQTIIQGQNASFSVTATGTSLSYQWQRSTNNGTSFTVVAGGTSAILNLTALPLADNADQYRVVVSNSAGSVTSNAATLTVNAAQAIPAFTTQPASLTVLVPNTATFNVVATGTPSPTLQWQLSTNAGVSFADIAGATASSYTTSATVAGDSGNQYRVVATNASGATTSTDATLTVNLSAAPSFTTQPANVSIVDGQNAQMSVVVSGTPTPTLQWQLSTDSGVSWSNIVGATGSVLSMTAVALANNGRQFRTVATNSAATVNSNAATLTVSAVPVPKAWQAAGLISAAADGDVYGYQIAYSANGDAAAVWMMYTNIPGGGVQSDIWANHYSPSTGWGAATLIETSLPDARDPQIGMDASGNAIAVWSQSDGVMDFSNINFPQGVPLRYNILVNRYVVGTGWGTASLINVPNTNVPNSTTTPQLAVAANGQAIATWSQRNASNTGVDILAGSYTPGTGWGTASTLAAGTDATVIVGGIGYNSNPGGQKVAIDASGNTMAVWAQFTGTQIDLFASRNSGTPEQIQTNVGVSLGPLQVASNATGETFVVWGQGCVAWANRYVPGTGWGTATALQTGNPTCGGLLLSPQIAIDANGNAIAAWVLNTGASITTYGNRYNAGTGWLGASPINYGGAGFQFAMNAAGNTLSTWKSSTILAGNNAYVTGYDFSPSVQILDGSRYIDPTSLKMAMDANGNAIALFKLAEVAGRNTIWASVYK